MERIVAAVRKLPIHVDQVLHAGDLGREDDAVVRHPLLFGEGGGAEGALDHRLHRHLARVERGGAGGVGVHQSGQELLIERTPIHPDPHRLGVPERHFEDRPEVLVLPLAAHVARIDPVLGERLGGLGVLGEEEVTVVVEVADDRDADPHLVEPLDDRRHRLGGRLVVHRDAHQLTPRLDQLAHLLDGRSGIRRIRIGHRLYHDGVARADQDLADADDGGGAAGDGGHWCKYTTPPLRPYAYAPTRLANARTIAPAGSTPAIAATLFPACQ